MVILAIEPLASSDWQHNKKRKRRKEERKREERRETENIEMDKVDDYASDHS